MKDGNGQQLMRPKMLDPAAFLSTTSIEINETQGTSSNASRIYAGFYPDLFIGMRSELRVVVLRERYADAHRSEEHTSELQSLMRTSYAVFCLKQKKRHS